MKGSHPALIVVLWIPLKASGQTSVVVQCNSVSGGVLLYGTSK